MQALNPDLRCNIVWLFLSTDFSIPGEIKNLPLLHIINIYTFLLQVALSVVAQGLNDILFQFSTNVCPCRRVLMWYIYNIQSMDGEI